MGREEDMSEPLKAEFDGLDECCEALGAMRAFVAFLLHRPSICLRIACLRLQASLFWQIPKPPVLLDPTRHSTKLGVVFVHSVCRASISQNISPWSEAQGQLLTAPSSHVVPLPSTSGRSPSSPRVLRIEPHQPSQSRTPSVPLIDSPSGTCRTQFTSLQAPTPTNPAESPKRLHFLASNPNLLPLCKISSSRARSWARPEYQV